ncbi:MAG: pkn1 4 [Actinomycetia bacterium]|nr:pkn1 4 [Actinomycetes bacterium]
MAELMSTGERLPTMHLTSGEGTALVDLARLVTEVSGKGGIEVTSAHPYDVSAFVGDPGLANRRLPAAGGAMKTAPAIIRERDGSAMITVPAGGAVIGTADEATLTAVAEAVPWYDVQHIEATMPGATTPAYLVDVFPVICGQFADWLNGTHAECVTADGGRRAMRGDVALAVDAVQWVASRKIPGSAHAVGIEWSGRRWQPVADCASLPVTLVTWHGARAYAEHVGARLPTETEWEKAARGPDGLRFPWGNEYEAGRANLADYWAGSPIDSQQTWDEVFYQGGKGPGWLASRPTPAGTFPGGTSPYGCQDMIGNVAEWCADLYDATGEGGRADFRAMRGAGRYGYEAISRCAVRRRRAPESVGENLGFRCVRALSDAA